MPRTRPFIIADNQDVTRLGITSLVTGMVAGTCVHHVHNRAALLKKLADYPDSVVITDYTLFDFDGPDDLLNIIEGYRYSSWILFSDELSESFVRKVFFCATDLGAVMKTDALEEIRKTVDASVRYETIHCANVGQILASDSPAAGVTDILTASERSVLAEIAKGKTTKEIAHEKCLSFHTVNSHRKNIFRKLGVNNVHEAIRYAMKAGIADMSDYYI